MGAKFKRYSSYKPQPNIFKLLSNFLPNGPHKTMFEILKIEIFIIFFSFLLTWDPMEVNISKHYSSYKSQPKVFKLVLNFPPSGPHKTVFVIFEILSFRFLRIFFQNFKFTIVAYGEIKNINYLENERSYSKTEWNLGLVGSTSTYIGYFWLFSV